MSKILIDEDVLKALIDSAHFEARDFRLYQGYGDFSDRVYAQIAKAEKAIEVGVILHLVTGKKLTLPVAEEFEVFRFRHALALFSFVTH